MDKQITIIEDEPHIGENYRDAFTKRGFKVSLYRDKESALTALADRLPDLVLIDLGLGSDADAGFDICQQLRARTKTLPIVFLTARDSEIDEVSGLRLGADDYLSKDIKIDHVIVRVTALLRRVEAYREIDQSKADISKGDLSINEDCMRIKWKEQLLEASVTEFWMIKALCDRPGHIKSKDALMAAANLHCEDNTITSHIRRIRNKFKALDSSFDKIETMHLAGYRWRAD
jgi:two-component system OmpR family response regulator